MRTRGKPTHCARGSLIALHLLAIILMIPVTSFSQGVPKPEKTFTVVIDPGHGGKDPGAIGKVSREKDLALAIATKTGGYISSLMEDVEVIYTRTMDEYIDLYRRADIARENKADLFVSIHVNANDNPSIYGSETYVMGQSKSERNLELAIKENSVIMFEENQDKYQGFDPNDPADYIKFSLYQNTFINQSLLMASQVQDQLRIRAKRKDGGVRQGPFLVLWRTTMPSVLIETGYISNREEEKYLNTEYGQDIIASAIYRAFRNYKEETEARTAIENTLADKNTTSVDESSEPAGASGVLTDRKNLNSIGQLAEEKKAEEKTVADSGDSSTASANDGKLYFRVQVMASRKQIPEGSSHFKGQKDLEEFYIDGYYKYMTQPIDGYSESQDLRKKLDDKFPGAFIIAYLNGKIIPLKEAVKLEKE